MSHSLEMLYQVWDDQSGERIEIGPDRDALGLFEIRQYSSESKLIARISFPEAQRAMIIQALQGLSPGK